MNCKKIQDFIITDYIDSRMGDKQKSLIEQHLAHCHACGNFLIRVKKDVVGPFANVNREAPDQVLWERIKQSIAHKQEEQLEKSLMPDFWERFRSAVHIPRPAFALATVVTMIFMIGTTGQFFMQGPIMKINGPDQVQYLSSLIDDPVDISGSNGNESQTPIEKYFL